MWALPAQVRILPTTFYFLATNFFPVVLSFFFFLFLHPPHYFNNVSCTLIRAVQPEMDQPRDRLSTQHAVSNQAKNQGRPFSGLSISHHEWNVTNGNIHSSIDIMALSRTTATLKTH
jgi:hypothetical protein